MRRIKTVIRAALTNEGDGAKVARAIGSQRLDSLDPFLLLDEFFVAPPAGFPDHPHRGFATVTYMLHGAFKHKDNKGHEGVIKEHGIQWMTAGKGVVHSEMPATPGVNHGLQLWINLKSKDKMCEPSYQELDQLPEGTSEDGKVFARVIAGTALGVHSPVKLVTDAVYVDFTMREEGAVLEQTVNPAFNAFIYVLEGSVKVNGERIANEKDFVLFEVDSAKSFVRIEYCGSKPGRFVLIGGMPTGEPVARYGPFVMNTQDEIRQAFADYQSGRF
eukprot:ANDGO_02179.mRNA.1 Pirin-like protein